MINFAVFFKLFIYFTSLISIKQQYYRAFFGVSLLRLRFLRATKSQSSMWETKVGTIVYIFSTAQQSFFLFFINVGLVFVHLIKDILYFSSGYAFSDSINLSKSSSSKRKYLHFF